MDAEFQVHVEDQIVDLMQGGLTREKAEQRARHDFGSLELAKEECRDERVFEPVDRWLRNLRHAFRVSAGEKRSHLSRCKPEPVRPPKEQSAGTR
jgi:hypothetical protein